MQVPSGPRRGPTFNNRWWNGRRSWNLRTTNGREKASPKGANHIRFCSCSPPSGTIKVCIYLSAGSIPFGHSTRGYSHSPPSGTVECYLRNFSYIITSRVNRLTVNSRFFYSYTSKALELAFPSDAERCFFALRSSLFTKPTSP